MARDDPSEAAMQFAIRLLGSAGGLALALGMVVLALNLGCAGDECEGWSRFWLLASGSALSVGALCLSAASSKILIDRGSYPKHLAGWTAATLAAYLAWLLTASIDAPL